MKRITNNLGIDEIIATFLASETYTGRKPGKCISATSLLRSTQQQVLGYKAVQDENVIEVVDISTLLKSSIGTALHKGIQESWENEPVRTNALKNLGVSEKNIERIKVNPENPDPNDINMYFEKRVEKEFRGWTITGQFDLVVNGTVHDFKSTSTYTYINKTKEKDYALQGSIYRWLNPDLIKDDVVVIHYIFTDWNKNYALNNPDYPKCPFVTVRYPLLSIQEIETYMTEKLMSLDYYLDHPERDLPQCDNKTLMIDDVWQYFGTPTATRSSKNFTSQAEAYKYLTMKGGKGIIKKKEQTPKGCEYCSCRGICKQYKSFEDRGLVA